MSEKSERAQREEKILEFWKQNQIFEKTLAKESPKGEFVFYEGPPTANGRPGIHHLEARAFKDAIPRYKTMQGFHVRRKAGWDTHGLPVELEVEKQLNLTSKREIEEYGIAKFNQECKKNVWKYVDEWKRFTDRIGYWIDLDHPYITYENSYIESIWHILSEIEKKKLLYKDYKVLPWCPRCGTALSSHELAQGYKDVKDLSVYTKFKLVSEDKKYFLAWTTTPWTLPGNVALAVGKDIHYVEAKVGDETYILAKDRLSIIEGEYEIVRELKGKELLGLEYEPLYPFLKQSLVSSGYKSESVEKAYKIYDADFVNTQDGTGIVHTAVMYGQDDFVLGNKIGLPKYHLVDEMGHFKGDTGFLAGRFVRDEETAVEIIKDLAGRNLLYKKEKYEHSYPHCWRCKTPLIYYARDSYYIRMSELRDKLVKENKKINWEPEYIKDGRFGEWLTEVKDWALSRERYWGTPLPIWQTIDGKEKIVVDSVDTLKKYSKKSDNNYFLMRHGGTEGNGKDIVSYANEALDHLTVQGRAEAETAALELKDKKIDLIVVSPFARAQETAEIVLGTLGFPREIVKTDERLREVNAGEFDGRPWHEYHSYMSNLGQDWFEREIRGGESMRDVVKRVGEVLYELELSYKGRNILIVTHGGPAWAAHVVSGQYLPDKDKPYQPANANVFVPEFKRFKNAEVRELSFVPLPHDENFMLDLHRPYIDEVPLEKDGKDYYRTKEVIDVWFDSGAMPFAQDHYPFEVRKPIFPADYISEAIDQTRGWFYTLHAIGVLMGYGHAYKNVISLGHILDKEDKKMSKSQGNAVDPWDMADKYGIDALRLWMYSVNQPGESKNFDERTVDEINKRVFNILDNVFAFYELYRDRELESVERKGKDEVENILDKWILSRLNELIELSTSKLESYKLIEPVRAIREFVEDLSVWYLRRSRERIKLGDPDAKMTLYLVLKNLARVLAPFAPFYAEDLYQKLRLESDVLSVHMETWPESGKVDQKVVEEMLEVRRIVSLALEQRARANVKVRQPLQKLSVSGLELKSEYLQLVSDEVNVKEVVEDKTIRDEVVLDTTLTPLLEEEGKMRDVIRSIQDLRKEKGLKPGEKMKYEIPESEKEIFSKYGVDIKRATDIEF